MRRLVTMIGTLPPIKGNAYYCMGLAREMAHKLDVEFIAFKKLYPNFIYPGGVEDRDETFKITATNKLSINRIITYYNPFSWVYAALSVRASIVHLQYWSIPIAPIYIVILLILKLRRKRIIFTVHNVVPHESTPIDKFLTELVLRFGDRFIVHSNKNRYDLLEKYSINENQVDVVHMPVLDVYDINKPQNINYRRTLGIPDVAHVILSFGNIRDYKGLDILITALAKIVRSVPSAHLLIVGQLWIDWGKCKELIKSYGLDDKVTTIFDYVPNSQVKNYFLSSDLVVLPYKHFDAQSGVGSIALAFGLPLIVTKVGGLPDLIKDRRAIVAPNNVGELANAITNVFLDPQLDKKLRQDSVALGQQYSWEANVNSTLSIYEAMWSRITD